MIEATRKKVITYASQVKKVKEQEINDKKQELELKRARLLSTKNSLDTSNQKENYLLVVDELTKEITELEREIAFLSKVLIHDTMLETTMEFSELLSSKDYNCSHDIWIFFGKHPLPTETRELYHFYCLDCEKNRICSEENVSNFLANNRVLTYNITGDDWRQKLFGNPDGDVNILQLIRNKYFELLMTNDSTRAASILEEEFAKHNQEFTWINYPTKLSNECHHDVWFLLQKCVYISLMGGEKYAINDDETLVYKYKCMDCDLPVKYVLKGDNPKFVLTHRVIDVNEYGWDALIKIRSKYLELVKTYSVDEAISMIERKYLDEKDDKKLNLKKAN